MFARLAFVQPVDNKEDVVEGVRVSEGNELSEEFLGSRNIR